MHAVWRRIPAGGHRRALVPGLARPGTNDALHALRAYVEPPSAAAPSRRRIPVAARRRRPRRMAAGRWSRERLRGRPSATEWATAMARQLLARHGVLTREAMNIESVPGGFSAVYDVLRAMEEAGRVRRGLFVDGLGAAQFALPAALDVLRSVRDPEEAPLVVTLAATDPGQSVRRHPQVACVAGWRTRSRLGPSARASCSWTASSPPGSVAAIARCWCGCPRTSRSRSRARTGARLRARPPRGCGLRSSGLARRGDQRRRHRGAPAREISGRRRLRPGRDGDGEGAPSVIALRIAPRGCKAHRRETVPKPEACRQGVEPSPVTCWHVGQ